MPLNNIKARCTAKSKSTGSRCRNPAAFGCKTCRVHGARTNIVSGRDHHWYTHGERSKDTILTVKEIKRRLAYLEEIGYIAGILKGRRTPGRKPS